MEPLQSPTVQFPNGLPPITLNPISATTILLAAAIAVLFLRRTDSKIPHVNPPAWNSSLTSVKRDAAKHGLEIYNNAKKRFPGRAFRMISNFGELIVLPPRYAHSIRNEEKLSFGEAIMKDFQGHIPGLEPFGSLLHKGQVLQNLARKPLTKLLNTVTEPLASETIFATNHIFGNPTEWKETLILDSALDLIARLSSRVFLGDRLCRNEDWLKVTKEYTRDGFQAAFQLTKVPNILKSIVPIFSPQFRDVRSKVRRARELIKPVIEERRVLKEQARKAGQPVPKFNDAIEWAEVECNGFSYDPVTLQLTLSFAAIHTTSDLLSKIMLLLAKEPELMKPLREEIVHVLKQHGWSKNALFNMKLVDSTMKETQRMMPNERVGMRRLATEDVYLKEAGITIRKGQTVAVDDGQRDNPAVFENPEKFDIYRWYRMREDRELANKAHFVSTSPDHLTFGHGRHACPGRFFAANEIKIALCFLLLKYDWELAPGGNCEPIPFGISYHVNPKSTLRYRAREAEIDLEALQFE